MTTYRLITAEERAGRVRAALAEVGYPNALVVVHNDQVAIGDAVPAEVRWRAFWTVGDVACWPCFRANDESYRRDCPHCPRTGEHDAYAPGAERPPVAR